MKCQKCDKTATFHITEMINAVPEELHLCDEHAREYLHQNESCRSPDADEHEIPQEIAAEDELAEQESNLKELTEELESSDFDCCPCCECSFLDFRKSGRLGCENDYKVFRERLEPLLGSIHGTTRHRGKKPTRRAGSDVGAQLVRLRNDLVDAIETEDYERASVLRDKIAELSGKSR